MKIIQMSDFHINNTIDINNCNNKINKLYDAIHGKIKQDEDIIFCICGDIIDKGDESGFNNAEKVFSYIKTKFKDFNCYFEFVPGNHDLVNNSFNEFDTFIEKFLIKDKYSYKNSNVIIRKYSNIDLVLVNSIVHKDFKYGLIDCQRLKEALNESNNKKIIVTHHTLMSRYNDDVSPIRNSYDLVNLITENNVYALIHGHTHGCSDITIGENCKVIGVGPFLKQVIDTNNQFNFIEIVASEIDNVLNMSFRADLDEFNAITIYIKKNINYYEGAKISNVYQNVLENTKAYRCINNFNMHITAKIEDFFNEIERTFPNEIEVAKQWQQKNVPDTLYYNHGMYIDKGEINGLDYIINELNGKATSSRAILPLINVKDVIKSGDGFLPSFDLLQFGFNEENKNKLCITLYLRALEVNHFLKINLCEIYLMAKQIYGKIRSIGELSINIMSFRAQYKENFGCFQKAKIDSLDCADIMILVMDKDIDKIVDLLNNKLLLSETVVIDSGVINLCQCINKYDERGKENFYSKKLIENISILKTKYSELKDLRRETSIYKKIEIKEEEVTNQMKIVINQLKELKGDKNDND